MKITEKILKNIIREALNNLPSYEDWRRKIENETMWRQYEGKRDVWKVNGNLVFDSSGHATGHLGYSLVQKALELVDFTQVDERGFISQTVEFPENIGYQECVPTTDKDNIIYAQRSGRKNVSRFALDREPEQCNSIFIVLRNIKGTRKWQIITAYVGTKSGLEPLDKRAKETDEEFWRNHALVSQNYTEKDDVGDSTYWRTIAESMNITKNILNEEEYATNLTVGIFRDRDSAINFLEYLRQKYGFNENNSYINGNSVVVTIEKSQIDDSYFYELLDAIKKERQQQIDQYKLISESKLRKMIRKALINEMNANKLSSDVKVENKKSSQGGTLKVSFGKNGWGITDELIKIGKIVHKISQQFNIYLDECKIDKMDDVYDFVFHYDNKNFED